MRILVTGGAGFIGSHIVKQLLEQGHKVVVYDLEESFIVHRSSFIEKNSNGQQRAGDQRPTNNDQRITFIQGDVKDSKLLVESLKDVDAVIHMAAFISVEESVKNPLKYMENNVIGTASLLTAMREAGVRKIVFSSSATVYGEPKSLPILEDAPLSAANPYAASKIAMEAIAESFARTDGFDVTILRYFNPYGPGENHQPETHAIPNFIKAGLSQGTEASIAHRSSFIEKNSNGQQRAGDEPITNNQTAIPLYWKGEQVRDFIYVEDLARAHIAVLENREERRENREENFTLHSSLFTQGSYRVFNVGSERGVKIIDVINVLSDILGYKLDIEDLGERPGDVMANYASSAKLKQATGWEAKVGLEEGLRKTVEWFKEEMGDKRDRGN